MPGQCISTWNILRATITPNVVLSLLDGQTLENRDVKREQKETYDSHDAYHRLSTIYIEYFRFRNYAICAKATR